MDNKKKSKVIKLALVATLIGLLVLSLISMVLDIGFWSLLVAVLIIAGSANMSYYFLSKYSDK